MKPSFDVVIIGGGIAGIATAYYLSTQHHITRVLLVDKRPPMTFTSDKSGSNYRNWWPHPAMAQLANHSIDLMDDLAQDTHNIFNLNRRGYAYFSKKPDLEAYLEAYSQNDVGEIRIHRQSIKHYQPNENPAIEGADILLGNDLIRQVVPFVSDDIQSMIHVRRAGWISTRVMAQHMLDVATRNGLLEMRGEVTQLEPSGDHIQLTIQTPSHEQTVTTEKLLLAVGPDLPQLSEQLNLSYPLENIFHQKVMLRDDHKILPDGMPFMIFSDAPTCHWAKDEADYVHHHAQSDTIPGNFHIRRVNQDWIHLGWAFNRIGSSSLTDNPYDPMYAQVAIKGIASFISALQSVVDHIPQPIVISGGFYTRTPENLPIIEETKHRNIYVIGALSGFGVMMGCGIGQLMSDMMMGKAMPDYVKAFSASRYENPDYQQQLKTMSSGEL